jgi:hypothetical protein
MHTPVMVAEGAIVGAPARWLKSSAAATTSGTRTVARLQRYMGRERLFASRPGILGRQNQFRRVHRHPLLACRSDPTARLSISKYVCRQEYIKRRDSLTTSSACERSLRTISSRRSLRGCVATFRGLLRRSTGRRRTVHAEGAERRREALRFPGVSLVMRPHPDDFHDSLAAEHLVDEAMVDVDAARAGSGEIAR